MDPVILYHNGPSNIISQSQTLIDTFNHFFIQPIQPIQMFCARFRLDMGRDVIGTSVYGNSKYLETFCIVSTMFVVSLHEWPMFEIFCTERPAFYDAYHHLEMTFCCFIQLQNYDCLVKRYHVIKINRRKSIWILYTKPYVWYRWCTYNPCHTGYPLIVSSKRQRVHFLMSKLHCKQYSCVIFEMKNGILNGNLIENKLWFIAWK